MLNFYIIKDGDVAAGLVWPHLIGAAINGDPSLNAAIVDADEIGKLNKAMIFCENGPTYIYLAELDTWLYYDGETSNYGALRNSIMATFGIETAGSRVWIVTDPDNIPQRFVRAAAAYNNQ